MFPSKTVGCSKQQIGKEAESAACLFLQEKGMKLIQRNYHCPFGEIDLIMLDGDMLVFVEVRKRMRSDYGNAIESVNHKKQKKLLRTSRHYLQRMKLMHKVTSRFDIIAFHPIAAKMELEWLKNVCFEE